MPVRVGSRLGPYEVLAPLGAGGMGEVYRSKDTRLAREVAIKVLPAELARDPSRLKRFEKEARAASALNHPNIVTIYDVGSQDTVSYIAMERIDGKTLREHLFAGALPVRKLIPIAAQVADGLARAHEAGIVHRDLKPENVMLTRDGLVKILDFGLAKQAGVTDESGEGSRGPTETGTSPGVVLGTVGYMSPEQAAGQAVDFRSDQFSFGTILYEMVTGRQAFRRKTSVDTLAAILNEEPEPIARIRENVPAPVSWIVERCLAKEPENRYGSTRDLARDLATLRDRLPESAAIRVIGDSSLPSRRRLFRLALAPISLALLATGLLAGWLLWKAAPAPPAPSFQQLTFREETVQTARFAPDGETIVYDTVREGKPFELFSSRVGSLESRPLGLRADILSISSAGQLAIRLGEPMVPGTLAEAPLAGGAPREILENVRWADWNPDGKALTIVRSVGGKERLEFPIGRILFESPGFVGSPRFSRDGNRIVFANGPALALADLKSKRIRTVGESGQLTGYAWSPTGQEIWMSVVSGATTQLRAIRPGGPERVLAALPGEFGLQDVSENGRVLVERTASRAEMLALAPGESREKSLSWLDGSTPADISPDGSTVLFTETGAGSGGVESVYIRRTDGSDAVRLGSGYALALSGDGKWALIRRGGDTILMPTDAGTPQTIQVGGIAFQGGATFFPDSKRILLSGTVADISRLYKRDVEGGEVRAVTGDEVFLPEVAHTISPDGKSVIARDRTGAWSIYSLEAGAAFLKRRIAGLSGRDKPIRWSAKGRSLFVVDQSGTLLRLDLASGHRELFKEFRTGSVVLPTPDGKSYVYGYRQDSSRLFLIEGLM